VLLTLSAAAALTPPTASAIRLIPPPGPWPTTVSGASNPLTGTPFVFNGGHATANARLAVWLPVGRQRRAAITRTIGGRTVIRGRLRNRDTGRSISGATLTVAAQDVYGGEWIAVGSARANRRGRFRAVLGAGMHRRVAALYWPAVNSPGPVYSRRLLVRAASRVYLRRPSRRGRRVRFDGHVSGAAVPASGLLVALQVRNSRGNWITARLAHTKPDGKYRIRYRFAPGRLRVRVSVPTQNGWVLYGSHSSTRRITVP
jgi:hypothetical protein